MDKRISQEVEGEALGEVRAGRSRVGEWGRILAGGQSAAHEALAF